MVPVTTMEGMPVLTPKERTELLRSPAEAEAEINPAGTCEIDAKTFKDRFTGFVRRETIATHGISAGVSLRLRSSRSMTS